MGQQQRGSAGMDPVLVLGTIISVGLSVLFFIREDTSQALGTIAGLTGGVITLQIQILLRDRRRVEHETRIGTMLSTIEQIPWLPDLLSPMLRAAKHVEREYQDTPASQACQAAFEDCLRTLADLERGHFRTPYGDNDLFLRLIAKSRHTITATSVPGVDLSWWKAPVGRQYWQAQVDALARGVRIRRVFIYQEWGAEIDAIAREQVEAGADVRRVHLDRLTPDLRVITAVWDGKCAHELPYTAGGAATHDVFTVSPTDLERVTRQFEFIWRCAVGIDEPEPTGMTGAGV